MFRNYFKTAWRNLWKNKIYSSINVIGLAIGMAACILILTFVFYEKSFADVYRADSQVSSIVGILAGLAIVISCLGLFGLASYSAERRIKEVGIRKVLGASVQNIVGMLSKDFLKYVLIAALIACPIAWFSVYKWLQDYAYRINLNGWTFLLIVFVALIIALITVSFQAIRAAVANPVNGIMSGQLSTVSLRIKDQTSINHTSEIFFYVQKLF